MQNNQLLKGILCLLSLMLLSTLTFAQVQEQWVKRYNGPGNNSDGSRDVAVDAQGNVYVTGSSYDSGTDHDYTTIKYDPDGNELWIKRYNGPGNSEDVALSLAVDTQGNVYVTGRSAGSDGDQDYATIKYDAAGNELWVRRYDGPGNADDWANTLVVDPSGNVYITGSSTGNGSSYDYATIKYDAAGNQLWLKRYNSAVNGYDWTNSIAVDLSGNVIVTGFISVGDGSFDYATVKYDTNGNELWVRTYNGTGDGFDWFNSVVVDLSSNIYVTGSSHGISGNADYATIKYDAAGNQVWVKRYSGLENNNDVARSIAVDAQGNVYVTGFSEESEGNPDYTTIRYDAAGNEIWVRRYDGPANSNDDAIALALDAQGNVYVTGTSDGLTSPDYATIKYDVAGNELWVIRYDGPTHFSDFVTALAVDANGNVLVTGASDGDFATVKYAQTSVTDVSCGKNGDKVLVCHKGKTLCISPNAVDAHLKHGDQLGSCNSSPDLNSITENRDASQLVEQMGKQFRVLIAPNPFNTTTTLRYELPGDGTVSIKVYDVVGREVATVVKAERKAGMYQADLSATDLAKGVYYYRALLTTKKKIYIQAGKIMVVK